MVMFTLTKGFALVGECPQHLRACLCVFCAIGEYANIKRDGALILALKLSILDNELSSGG